MRLKYGSSLFFVLFLTLVGVEAGEHPLFEIPNTRVIPIQDTEAGKQYELYIKLPENYKETTTYPVIYFTDAVWHIELLSASTAFLFSDVILVGISWQKDVEEELKDSGDYVSRFRDYSIKPSSNPEVQAKYKRGQAANHLRFIHNDVFPYVAKHFRTDPERRTYFGYSMGGLFGSYVLLARPETFKNYIIGSPVVKDDIFDFESPALKSEKVLSANVFISVGEKEKPRKEQIEAFISKLKSKNYKGFSLKYLVVDDADHTSGFPETGLRSVEWLSKLEKGSKE